MDIVLKQPAELKPYLMNAKLHPRQQVHGLAESIRRFGFTQPIVINREGEVIIGHGRLEAAKLNGLLEVPCVVLSDLSEHEVRALRLLDNRLSETGWDANILSEDLDGIKFDFGSFGIDFESILAKADNSIKEGLTDADSIPDHVPDAEPVTKPGDRWRLGNHLLICVNAWKTNHGEKNLFELVITTLPDDFLIYDLDIALSIECHLKNGGVFYIFHPEAMRINAEVALKYNHVLEIKQTLIWVKSVHALSRQDYNWKHEAILYGWKSGAAHYWSGDYSNTTVFEESEKLDFKKMTKEQLVEFCKNVQNANNTVINEDSQRSSLYPGAKPVKLLQRLIQNSSRLGETVFDPYLGYGSTLIACEVTGRKCYGMEPDPAKCDRIIKRWENFTGKKASLVSG